MSKLITRSITVSEVITLGVNSETGESENRNYTFVGKLTEKKALEKAIEVSEGTAYHPALVVSLQTGEILRAMPIERFIEYSTDYERKAKEAEPVTFGEEN